MTNDLQGLVDGVDHDSDLQFQVELLGRQRRRGRAESYEAPRWQVRILVDRFIYQGLRCVPSRHASHNQRKCPGHSKIRMKGLTAEQPRHRIARRNAPWQTYATGFDRAGRGGHATGECHVHYV